MPFASTEYVLSRFVFFSVTTSVLPDGSKETSAGPEALVLSGRVEPAIGARSPCDDSVKPEMFPAPPALSAYTRLPEIVTLIGIVPPDATLSASVSEPSPFTRNDEISLLPASTTTSVLPDSSS